MVNYGQIHTWLQIKLLNLSDDNAFMLGFNL